MLALAGLEKQRATAGSPRHAPSRPRSADTWISNQALQAHLRRGDICAKLTVGGTADPAEQEADRIADRAVSGAAPCACGGGPTCGCPKTVLAADVLRRKPTPDSGGTLRAFGQGRGQSLDSATRRWFEPHFGDLASVRVHNDAPAQAAAGALNARAFTAGNDIAFAPGEYDPSSRAGRWLIAHELAHSVQARDAGGAPMLRRQPRPSGGTSAPFRVETITAAEYEQMTGSSADSLPEKRYISAGSLAPGAGIGGIIGPRPTLPLPIGSTGFMWQGSHVTHLAVLPQENPFLSFLFGPGRVEAGGFRASLFQHGMADVPGPLGRYFRDQLYFGTPGSYANDAIFPYMPGATAAHTPGGEAAIPEAEALVEAMRRARPDLAGETYRFSTPRNPETLRRLIARWQAAGVDPCPPGASNCINLVRSLTEQSIGGQTPTIERGGQLIDAISGMDASGNPAPSSPASQWPGTPMREGEAVNMDEYLGTRGMEPGGVFEPQGLLRTPLTRDMWLRGATGVVRAGGTVLLIYGAVNTVSRVASAPNEELPVVLGEEAGAWGGGAIGAILGEALGTVVICGASGPGVALCIAVVGMAGGAVGSAVGQAYGHDLGEGVKQLRGPGLMDTLMLMFGSAEQKQQYGETRQVEGGGGRSPSIWDLFGAF